MKKTIHICFEIVLFFQFHLYNDSFAEYVEISDDLQKNFKFTIITKGVFY